MSLITDGTLTPASPHSVTVSYAGTGYSYIDGEFIAGPDVVSATLPRDPDSVFALEIHSQTVSTTINEQPQLNPLIIWTAVSGAERYNVYHTPPGGSESKIWQQMDEDDIKVYKLRCPVTCIEGWQLFRVESVDSGGNESTVSAWAEYVYNLPDGVSDASLSGSSGTFTLTITE